MAAGSRGPPSPPRPLPEGSNLPGPTPRPAGRAKPPPPRPARVIGAFLCWSLSLQALAAAWQLARRGRLDAARLGVDSLVLSTNNTGILGPVVLQAALGPKYAPMGMLATVSRG